MSDEIISKLSDPVIRRKSLKKVSRKLKARKRLSFLPKIDKIDKEILKAFKTNDAFLLELVENNVPACELGGWLKLQKMLGKGSFGEVRQVCVPKKKCKYEAVLKRSLLNDKQTRASFINEAIVLNYIWDLQLDSKKSHGKAFKIDYRHFILYFHHWFGCGRENQVGYQLMEKGGKSLDQAMDKKRSDRWWFNVLGQVLTALNDLNRIKVNHNDLHEGNIILLNPNSAKDVLVKIIDFGAATVKKGQLSKENEKALSHGIETFFFEKTPDSYEENRDLRLFFTLLNEVANPKDEDEFVPMSRCMSEALATIAELPKKDFTVENVRRILKMYQSI